MNSDSMYSKSFLYRSRIRITNFIKKAVLSQRNRAMSHVIYQFSVPPCRNFSIIQWDDQCFFCTRQRRPYRL